MVARAFTHEDPIGIAAHQIHNVVGDQAVINHNIGLLYLLQAFEGQQSGIARAGAYQHYFAAMIQRLGQQLLRRVRDGLAVLIGQRLRQPVVNKQFLPKAAAFANGGKLFLHPGAQLTCVVG